MAKSIAILLDKKRLEAIKGSPITSKITDMFGGAVKAIIVEVADDKSKEFLNSFVTARIDNRNFITDLPVACTKAIFEEIAKKKSIGPEVIDAVLKRVADIKKDADKESEYLPAPDL